MIPITDPALLQSLMDHAGMLVLGLDTKGRIQWMSRGLEQLTGYNSEEMTGKDWVENLIPQDHRAAAALLCRGSAGTDRSRSHVKPLLQHDGGQRHVEWFHSDIKDDEGRVTGILCMGRDVTELQLTREALVSSEKRSSAVLETAVNAIITINEEKVIETVNSATERIFGYSRDEMVGRNIQMLMPQPYRDKHDSYVQNYLNTGVKKIIGIGREVVGQRKDGTVFPMDLSVGEARLPEGRRVFTGIIRDLTDRKILEEKILQISEEEQHRIGQDIHDDLCQQLAAIGCLAKVAHQQLQKSGNAEAANLHEIVQLVTQANVRAREMSRGLMPVVLDAAGLMAALAELTQGTERIFRVSCPFRCERPVEVPDNTMATQLFRIAQEAVANAIKHSHAERIEITLAEEEGHLLLCIRDNGVGIPDNVPGHSTGMGLLTMTHRARMMGGMLTVQHDDFGGTVVRCTVPVSSASKQPVTRKKL
ncbi:PAS domain-containing sensor histidine kinase [Prosthecobacter fusiformis]|nr:PAS domain S-box protein [Prosthecobacter fusiformis]